MAGIYIHIPYCRQACRYCDFHFIVSVWNKKELLPYLLREIEERKTYLEPERIDTIYFGGGTPSVLEYSELNDLLERINKFYTLAPDAEISFEANPEDLKREYLKDLRKTGINRLSIGIQSFNDSDLELMHRIHDSKQAMRAVRESQQEGFDNISIDLIYGIPRQEAGTWDRNLETALSLETQHFSAYHLSFEPGTIFDHWRKKGRLEAIPEEASLEQFKVLTERLTGSGYEHYEISNFALPGFQSRHNSSYWKQKPYIGIGPSAHSYNGVSRRWNFSNNKKYSDGMLAGEKYYESEVLTPKDRYNEFLMTSLRTQPGLDIEQLQRDFGEEKKEIFLKGIEKFIKSSHVVLADNVYKLTREGIFISDHIISEVFI